MLDPLLLRTFLVIAAGHSFSETSRRLSLRQSTVSDHVRRLEQAIGHQLFLRDTHSVVLTREGRALVGFAREILAAHERTERHFAGASLRGRLRCGASPEVGPPSLMPLLRGFAADHRGLDLEVTVAPAGLLRTALDAGDLDLVVCERRAGDGGGERLWQDDLSWVGATVGSDHGSDNGPNVGAEPGAAADGAAVPLILLPAPSVSRAIVLDGLERNGRPWRLACTGGGLADLAAAAGAGLGVAALPDRLVPAGLARPAGLPALEPLDVVALRGRQPPGAAADELVGRLRAWGEAG